MAAHIIFRPAPQWTDPITSARKCHGFTAGWLDTCDMLCREVEHLSDERTTTIVLEVGLEPRWVRRDGGLRADAKVQHPGVIVSFDSRHGPLRYACDTFEARWSGQMPGWQANVRAIALGLEALRKVDRYGIAQSGQQYTGWAALGAGVSDPRLEACEVLRIAAGFTHGPDEDDPDDIRRAWRHAVRRTHPDTGGGRAEFDRVQAAFDLLIKEA